MSVDLQLDASALVTIAEARTFVWRDQDDGTRDPVLIEAANVVSAAIADHCERELTPTASATRTFALRTKVENGQTVGWIDLSPFDLRTATTVRLYTDSTPQTLTTSEYRKRPVGGARGGTYLDLITIAPTAAEVQPGFGWEADIAGAWGMATVPETVKKAALIWIKNLVENPGAYVQSEMGGHIVSPDFDLGAAARAGMPAAVRHRLQPYRRRP